MKRTFAGFYCINLDHRTEKWAAVQEQLAPYGMADVVQREPGVYLKEDPRYKDLDRLQAGKYSILSAAGCTMAHRNVVAKAKKLGLESVFIFEDDFKFLEPEIFKGAAALADLNKRDWGLFYLGATYNKALVRETDHLLSAPEGAHAFHAYAYHQKTYNSILNCLPEDPMDFIQAHRFEVDNVDVWIQSMKAVTGDIFATDPIMAVQKAGTSDTDQTNFVDYEKFQRDLFTRHAPQK